MTNKYECRVVWGNGARVRPAPSVNNEGIATYEKDNYFFASDMIPDNEDPNNPDKVWAKISEGQYTGRYVAVEYPSSSGETTRAVVTELGPSDGVNFTLRVAGYKDFSGKLAPNV